MSRGKKQSFSDSDDVGYDVRERGREKTYTVQMQWCFVYVFFLLQSFG
jgi:hypothetical protein